MTRFANPVFVALDTPDVERARALAEQVGGAVGGVKLGLEFFNANGPDGVRRVTDGLDLPLFLDLKFHDIPNTVAGAVRSVMPLAPAILNIHASGGREMMRRAAEACAETADHLGLSGRPALIGVTVLTSLADDDLKDIGVGGSTDDQVVRLALLAKQSGLDGVVCSARETERLRAECGEDFLLVVPGIRPAWSAADDQKRIVTPAEGKAMGADVLVIGRPITAAASPAEAARRVAEEIDA